jgi:hypothetical protein
MSGEMSYQAAHSPNAACSENPPAIALCEPSNGTLFRAPVSMFGIHPFVEHREGHDHSPKSVEPGVASCGDGRSALSAYRPSFSLVAKVP